MSKILNAQNILGPNAYTHQFAQIPPIKINFNTGDQNNPEPGQSASGFTPDNKEPGSEDRSDHDRDEHLIFVPQADNRFPIAVLVLVSFLGLAMLILNLRLLDEIKFERQTLLLLSTNIEKMANRMTGLDKVVEDFKEQSLEQAIGLKSAVGELSSALTTHETSVSGLSEQIDDLKSGLTQVNAVLGENKADLVAVNKNSENIQSKLDAISTANQNLVAQYEEIRDILKPKAEVVK